MRKKAIWSCAVVALVVAGGLGVWWWAGWTKTGPSSPSGGLYFPWKIEVPGPHFAQSDPKWGADFLGPTDSTLAAEGCAVTSAAMALGSRGADVDPGRLNKFLAATPGGFTERGWVYWEKAAEFDPSLTPALLPHYEDAASHYLIDSNLLAGNPVIARLRYPSGITHFVLICGKDGFDYLIRDPGRGFSKGVYPLKEFGGPIEAIRFYRKK